MQFELYIDSFLAYMQSGGFVMWPLFILAMLLWYGLGFRFHTVNRGSKKSVRTLVRKYSENKRQKVVGIIDEAIVEGMKIVANNANMKIARKELDDSFYYYETRVKSMERLVRTIVIVAPLIGLLGTVVGMIETFDSLASSALFSQTGGIAGGISQALFTTQLGLVVAVPGLIIGRLLERHASIIEFELEQIKDILCSQGSSNAL
ncbi:MAG: MotA/TolQ/ExbB proton channel family protein [Campylobacterota bacterium]|nr:MotA/TolQ/ExbB proton channel family protein [Campylobacterota bacterium]